MVYNEIDNIHIYHWFYPKAESKSPDYRHLDSLFIIYIFRSRIVEFSISIIDTKILTVDFNFVASYFNIILYITPCFYPLFYYCTCSSSYHDPGLAQIFFFKSLSEMLATIPLPSWSSSMFDIHLSPMIYPF